MSNIVRDVLEKPRQWKATWTKPEVTGMGLQEALR